MKKYGLWLSVIYLLMLNNCHESQVEIEPNLLLHKTTDVDRISQFTLKDWRYLADCRIDKYRLKEVYATEIDGLTIKVTTCANMTIETANQSTAITLKCEIYEFFKKDNIISTTYYGGNNQAIVINNLDIANLFSLTEKVMSSGIDAESQNNLFYKILEINTINLSAQWVKQTTINFNRIN